MLPRRLAGCLAILLIAAACREAPAPAGRTPFTIVEATIPQMREAMEQGRLTSYDLVEMYLARLGMYQHVLRAAIYVNANALEEAAERDRERAAGKVRGPLHGIPIALKDNIHYDKVTPPGAKEPRGGLNAAQAKAMAEAIDVLKQQGAVLVDPADIPSILDPDPAKNIVDWNFCGSADDVRGKDARCTIVVKYGMKRDFNKWLATLGPAAPVKSLTELREWNRAHEKGGAIRYGQSRLDISDEVDLEKDRPRYLADQAKDLALTTTSGIDAVMKQHQLDALLFPGSSGSGLSARPGYPSVIVPFALIPNEPTPPFPDGFNARPQPYGMSFAGLACSESRLLALAYAFEQATKRRVPPPGAP